MPIYTHRLATLDFELFYSVNPNQKGADFFGAVALGAARSAVSLGASAGSVGAGQCGAKVLLSGARGAVSTGQTRGASKGGFNG